MYLQGQSGIPLCLILVAQVLTLFLFLYYQAFNPKKSFLVGVINQVLICDFSAHNTRNIVLFPGQTFNRDILVLSLTKKENNNKISV